LPYVLLEAMAYGLPIASTNVDGIPEAVVEGESGLLVPPAEPSVLARAVAELLRDPLESRRMGEAGRARVAEHFSVEIMAEAVAKVYGEVVGR
jgi:glycosyltransferase involved in cell wall biosynthesis